MKRYVKKIDSYTIANAPKFLVKQYEDGEDVVYDYILHPTELDYNEFGYFELVEAERPDGYMFRRKYNKRNNKIYLSWEEVEDTRTSAEKREEQYRTLRCIEFDGQSLTVDEARDLFNKYFAEANTKYAELQSKIAEAKAKIREEYPDLVEPNEGEV